MIPIVILAAGQSARMRGRDKLLEVVEGAPLIRRQAHMARSATNAPVLIALPVAPHPRHDALAGLDVTPIEVPDAAEGMNASLRTAFAKLPAEARAAMVLLADLPALEANDLATVLAQVDPDAGPLVWRGTTDNGTPGHPVVFHADLFPAIRALTGDAGAQQVVRAAGDRVKLIRLPGKRARLDLDTPEDWAAWRAGHV